MIMMMMMIIMLFCIGTIDAQQFYDPHDCDSDTSYPGSRYTCNLTTQQHSSCQTFLVYRASPNFQTVSRIATLFNLTSDEVLRFNNFTSSKQTLQPHREVLVPIDCLCSGNIFQASFIYTVQETTTLAEIACGVYEGLLKSVTLGNENPNQENDVGAGTDLHVPLRCACPENDTLKYLVTYPFVEGDGTVALSSKFGISIDELWAANSLVGPRPTVYPNTTVLVPLKTDPLIIFSASNPPPPPEFLPTIPIQKTPKFKNLRVLYIAGSAVGFSLLLVAVLGCGFYVAIKRKQKRNGNGNGNGNLRSTPISISPARSSPRSGQISSTNSCLSPDLLASFKYSLNNYTAEELRRATNDFSEDNKISGRFFKGSIKEEEEGNNSSSSSDVMIKQMRFEDTRQVIDMHSKINHINVINLRGVCYGQGGGDHSCSSYLVFEFPANGCLRDCLSNASSNPLPWSRRTQIAFDVVTGLHYLHYCTFPTYAHMNVNTRSIFVTAQWRAKLANIGTLPTVGSARGNDHDQGESSGGGCWVAPEGLVQADVYALGVVLLELVSGRDNADTDAESSLKESIGFLGGEGGCFHGLKGFLDPSLKEDYPLAEALCLVVLAKSCVEDDPLRRPSMDDIIKVLTRMVY